MFHAACNNTDNALVRRPSPSQVFGSFVVCKDRSVLEAVAASGAPVDGITLDGDVMRRKGTISGGFVNAARSKILTHKRVRLLLAGCTGAFRMLVGLSQHRYFLIGVGCGLIVGISTIRGVLVSWHCRKRRNSFV